MDIDRIRDTTPISPVSQFCHTAINTSVKICHAVREFFIKAAVAANVGVHYAWNATKTVVGRTSEITKAAYSKISGSRMLELIAKVTRCVISFFSKAARVAMNVAIDAKNGAVHGFQVAKNILGAQSKETMIVGAGIILGSAIIYAGYQIYQSQRVVDVK
jgi:hypothetical protein